MEEHRKYILDRFQEHLREKFDHYCKRHGVNGSDYNRLLGFLIDQDLITPIHIQRYTVLKEFEQLYPELANHKTQTVDTLAYRFSISKRTVWSILKHVSKEKKP